MPAKALDEDFLPPPPPPPDEISGRRARAANRSCCRSTQMESQGTALVDTTIVRQDNGPNIFMMEGTAPPHATDTQESSQTLLTSSMDNDDDVGSHVGVPDAGGDVTTTTLHQEICMLMGSHLATTLGVDEDISTPPWDDLARMGLWKAVASEVDDEGFWKVPLTRGQRIIPSTIKVLPAIVTTLTKRRNSFAVLGTSQGEESPVPPTNRTLPDGACGVPPPHHSVYRPSFTPLFR